METTLSTSLPDQTKNNKTSKDFYEPTYDFYISKATGMNDKNAIKEYLDAADGIINEDTLNYMVTPLMVDDEDRGLTKVNVPTTIRNFDFITPIKEKNLGEYTKLPYTVNIKVTNPDVNFVRDTKLNKELDKLAQTAFINFYNQKQAELQQQQQAQATPPQPVSSPGQPVQRPVPQPSPTQVSPAIPSEPVEDMDAFKKKWIKDYIDKRAVQANHLLNVINERNNFEFERLKMYFYWWATEEFYTVAYPMNNTLIKETISPLEGYPIYNNNEFVEDYDAFVIVKDITFEQFLEDSRVLELTKDQIEIVNQNKMANDGAMTPATLMPSRMVDNMPHISTGDTSGYNVYNKVRKHIIFWPTYITKKYRIYVNSLGHTREEMVDDDYEMNVDEGDIEIKSELVPEIYIGYRYNSGASGVYVKPVPFPVQRYDQDTKHVKIPVGGKRRILNDIRSNPIPKRLIPYMIMDKIIYFQIERLMKKFKTHLMALPKSMINSDETGTMVEKFQMMMADDTFLYDDTVISPDDVSKAMRVVAMPDASNYFNSLIKLSQENENRANRVSHMNNETMGNAAGGDAVTNVENNIYNAKIGSMLMTTMFNKALELDHARDLEFAKYIYVDAQTMSYFTHEGDSVNFDFDPISFFNTGLGIYVRNSRIEDAIMQEYRKLALAMAQNDKPELAIAVIGLNSGIEIKTITTEFLEAQRKYEASVQQQQVEAKQYEVDKRSADVDKEIAAQNYRANVQAQAMVEAAQARTGSDITSPIDFEGNANAQRKLDLDQQKQINDENYKKQLLINADKKLALDKMKANKK